MIYSPSDDTFLIAEVVKKFASGKKVLDMGTGSGYLAECALNSNAKSVIACDINKEAIKILKEDKKYKKCDIKFVHSNLFDKIPGKFDLIIFNPPYLPEYKGEDKDSRLVTTGGKKGDEIILKFIKNSKKHLNEKGIILLLISSLTPKNRIHFLIKELKFKASHLVSKSIFFEELIVLKIEKQ